MSVLSLSYWKSDVYWRQNNKHFAELALQNGGKQLIWRNYVTVTLCIANLTWKFHANTFRSFCAKLLTDKHTDRQTDKQRQLHNLLGGGNNNIAMFSWYWFLYAWNSLCNLYSVQGSSLFFSSIHLNDYGALVLLILTYSLAYLHDVCLSANRIPAKLWMDFREI